MPRRIPRPRIVDEEPREPREVPDVVERGGVGDVQARGCSRGLGIDGEDATCEVREERLLEPAAQHGSLRRVLPVLQQHTSLDLLDRDRGQEGP